MADGANINPSTIVGPTSGKIKMCSAQGSRGTEREIEKISRTIDWEKMANVQILRVLAVM